jgi:hypothetical protein
MSAWQETSTTAKVVIFFAIVFLVSLGSCGLTAITGWGDMQAGMIELLLMLVSVVAIVVTLIAGFISRTYTE